MKKSIKVIFFSNEANNLYKEINDANHPVLFLHESIKTNKEAQDRIISQCKNDPIIFHYFSDWFKQSTLSQKLTSSMRYSFLGIYLTQFNDMDHLEPIKNGYAFLLHQVLVQQNLKIVGLENINLSVSFFHPREINVNEEFIIRKKLNQLSSIDQLVYNWLSSEKKEEKKESIVKLKGPFFIMYCGTKENARYAIQAVEKQSARGIVLCLEPIEVVTSKHVEVITVKEKSMKVIHHLIRKLSEDYSEFAVYLYWDNNSKLEDDHYQEMCLLSTQDPKYVVLNSIFMALNNKTKLPENIFKMSNLYSFKLSINHCKFDTIQDLLVQLMQLDQIKNIPIDRLFQIGDIIFSINIFARIISDSYFKNIITQIVQQEFSAESYHQIVDLDQLIDQGFEQLEKNTTLFIQASLKEIIKQWSNIGCEKQPNYERITLD